MFGRLVRPTLGQRSRRPPYVYQEWRCSAPSLARRHILAGYQPALAINPDERLGLTAGLRDRAATRQLASGK